MATVEQFKIRKIEAPTVFEVYLEECSRLQELSEKCQKKIEQMQKRLDEALKEEQKVCQHVDDGGIFYFTCKKCGYVGD